MQLSVPCCGLANNHADLKIFLPYEMNLVLLDRNVSILCCVCKQIMNFAADKTNSPVI